MSRLPKAPLIEVIFELRWTSLDANELQDSQYLHGDLYPLIKDKYPYREAIQGFTMPSFFNAPTHRFRTAANDYPLVQIGPGILTINTVDSKYFWSEYETWVIDIIGNLKKIYAFKNTQNVRLTLQYIDLVRFDFDKENVLDFLKEHLHITINQGFYTSQSIAKNVGLALNFDNDLGTLNISINRGKNTLGEDGIAIQTNLTSGDVEPEIQHIRDWLAKAHELTSSIFKEMTKGKLQEAFASK